LIGKEIEKTKGKVELASSTIEVIRIPKLSIDPKKGKSKNPPT
jgi:hypothetical protein